MAQKMTIAAATFTTKSNSALDDDDDDDDDDDVLFSFETPSSLFDGVALPPRLRSVALMPNTFPKILFDAIESLRSSVMAGG